MSTACPRAAFQGEPGAFSEEAVHAYFGGRAVPVPVRDVHDVVEAVRTERAAFGLLPIENSLAGPVVAAYDALAEGDVDVVGEVIRPIRLCLLALPGAHLDRVRRASSHPVALAQCRAFFARHPGIEPVAAWDTAGAASAVAAAGDPAHAAVAAERAAERYGLIVLATDLQDRADNQTRFYVVARRGRVGGAPGSSGPARTALLVETENRPGALVEVLHPLAERGINMTTLVARPGGVPWTYRFFIEFDAADAADSAAAVSAMRRTARSCVVLGSFGSG